MTKFSLIALSLLLVLADSGRAEDSPAPSANPVIPRAVVRVADQIKLPAIEAGVLVKLIPKDGAQVRAGEVIANIDDREPQIKNKAANADYAASYKKATDEVEIDFANAQYDVSVAEVKRLKATNAQAAGAIPQTELEKAELDVTHFKLAIKKAKHDQELARYEAAAKHAELDGTALSIDRRIVKAPFDGVVEELKKHESEWVQPGDTILSLCRLDTMHVEGTIEQSQYDPQEIQGCTVSVEVQLARGRKVTTQGRIVKVSTIVRGDGVYNVRAEVPNQKEQGTWMLRDGLQATMTIHLGTGSGTTAARAK